MWKLWDYTFLYKEYIYKEVRLRFGSIFLAIFQNIKDFQYFITQEESFHSEKHFKHVIDR